MKFKLSEEVKKISNVALKDLGRTLWELPEYYLGVKLAENLQVTKPKSLSELSPALIYRTPRKSF